MDNFRVEMAEKRDISRGGSAVFYWLNTYIESLIFGLKPNPGSVNNLPPLRPLCLAGEVFYRPGKLPAWVRMI